MNDQNSEVFTPSKYLQYYIIMGESGGKAVLLVKLSENVAFFHCVLLK